MKTCKQCGIQKDETQFSGRYSRCKTCRNHAQRKHYHENLVLEGDDLLTNEEQYFKRSDQLFAQIIVAEEHYERMKEREHLKCV